MSDKPVKLEDPKDTVRLFCPHCERDLAFIPREYIGIKWNFIKFTCPCGAQTSILHALKGGKAKKQLGPGTPQLKKGR